MKNWKRFIAACLSVTMVASIPFTAFAESSVSVKELVRKRPATESRDARGNGFRKNPFPRETL